MADEPPAADESAGAPLAESAGAPVDARTVETPAIPPPWTGQYAPPMAYPDPFAPVARAPKSPWIAPQRKGAVIAICIVAAIVLLGGGFVIGAVAVHHHDRGGFHRFDQGRPRQGIYYGPGARNDPGNGNRNGGNGAIPRQQRSGGGQRPGGASSSTPSAAPTS